MLEIITEDKTLLDSDGINQSSLVFLSKEWLYGEAHFHYITFSGSDCLHLFRPSKLYAHQITAPKRDLEVCF